MTGHRNGLIALLQIEQPSVIVVHCFAHRLELAFKDASKSNNLHEKVVATLLMGLYYFYHKSTVNRSMLKRCASTLQRKVHIPTRVGGTRWVGHLHRSLESVISSYPVIILHLQQVKFLTFHIQFFILSITSSCTFNFPAHKYGYEIFIDLWFYLTSDDTYG